MILRPTATRKRRTAKRVATTKLTTSATAMARRAEEQVDHVRRAQSQDGQRNDEYGERAKAHVQEVGELPPRWQRAVAHHVRDDVRDEHGEQCAQDR